MITQEQFQALLDGKTLHVRPCLDGLWQPVTEHSAVTANMMKNWHWRLQPAEKRDWAGALKWLKEGKRVRRPSWGRVLHVRMGSCGIVDHCSWGEEPNGSVFLCHDFEATDWEIVP